MERDDWRRITLDNIQFTVKDIRDKLIPVLKTSEAPPNAASAIDAWAKHLVEECRAALAILLPFQKNEIEFLELLQTKGKLHPELISNDDNFCQRVVQHPSLLWRAQQSLAS